MKEVTSIAKSSLILLLGRRSFFLGTIVSDEKTKVMLHDLNRSIELFKTVPGVTRLRFYPGI